MKRSKIGFLITMTAACTMFVAAAALAGPGVEVKADIPFSFFAGDQLFPAGQYVVTVDDPDEPTLLTIQTHNGDQHEFLLTEPETEMPNGGVFVDESKLVFNRYGNDHFLSEVEVAGLDEGRILPVSKLERERQEMKRERVTVRMQKAG